MVNLEDLNPSELRVQKELLFNIILDKKIIGKALQIELSRFTSLMTDLQSLNLNQNNTALMNERLKEQLNTISTDVQDNNIVIRDLYKKLDKINELILEI